MLIAFNRYEKVPKPNYARLQKSDSMSLLEMQKNKKKQKKNKKTKNQKTRFETGSP